MFGPWHSTLKRKNLKEGQVVTSACMTARAELVNDRAADAFLMAFRRFVSVRGHPRVCSSNCTRGENFAGAKLYLCYNLYVTG